MSNLYNLNTMLHNYTNKQIAHTVNIKYNEEGYMTFKCCNLGTDLLCTGAFMH